MGTKFTLFKFVLQKNILPLIVCLIFLPKLSAGAIISDVSAIRWYKVYWGGFHIADFKAKLTDNSLDVNIDSYGIVKKVSKYYSRTQGTFINRHNTLTPQSFYTFFNQRHRSRTIDLVYDKSGTIMHDQVKPPDNRAKRPAVPPQQKKHSFDPLTAFMHARSMVINHLEKDGPANVDFMLYDGRRLAKVSVEIAGRIDKTFKGTKHEMVKVRFKRHAIMGYTNNELKRLEGEEPDITVYLSDDELLLPFKVEAVAPLGKAHIVFHKECKSIDKC